MKIQSKLFLFLTVFFTYLQCLAQTIDLDKKTGMVKVDGKESFLLISKNSVLGQSDYSLQNLKGEELAYLKLKGEDRYDANVHRTMRHTYYTMTFSKTGNYCDLEDFTSFSIMKSLAKTIGGAGLVVNDNISQEAERKFIVMNRGVFFTDPTKINSDKVVVNVNVDKEPKPSANSTADVYLKDNKIYNHSEHIGLFKVSDNADNKLVQVYKADGSKIAEAKRPANSNDADWSVLLLGNNQNLTLLYDNTTPLEKLFKYLIEKGYFN